MSKKIQYEILSTLLERPEEIKTASFVLSGIFDIVWSEKVARELAEDIQKNAKRNILSDYDYISRHSKQEVAQFANNLRGCEISPALIESRCYELRENYLIQEHLSYNKMSVAYLEENEFDKFQSYENDFKKVQRPLLFIQTPKKIKELSLMENFMERQNNPEKITGIPTGIPELDNITMGLKTGTIHILAARPSHGKTALAGQIMLNVAEFGIPVLFISHEMDRNEICTRTLCNIAQTHLTTANQGKLNLQSAKRYADAIKYFETLDIEIYDESTVSLDKLQAIAEYHSNHNLRKKKRGLIIIDYIQLEHLENYKGVRTDELSEISAIWKDVARKTDYAILYLAQLNRDSAKKMPELSDLKGSGSLEQDAHTAMLLWRPGHDDDSKPANLSLINVAKNRNGILGRTELEFKGWCQRFESWNDQTEELDQYGLKRESRTAEIAQNKDYKDLEGLSKDKTPPNQKEDEVF